MMRQSHGFADSQVPREETQVMVTGMRSVTSSAGVFSISALWPGECSGI